MSSCIFGEQAQCHDCVKVSNKSVETCGSCCEYALNMYRVGFFLHYSVAIIIIIIFIVNVQPNCFILLHWHWCMCALQIFGVCEYCFWDCWNVIMETILCESGHYYLRHVREGMNCTLWWILNVLKAFVILPFSSPVASLLEVQCSLISADFKWCFNTKKYIYVNKLKQLFMEKNKKKQLRWKICNLIGTCTRN